MKAISFDHWSSPDGEAAARSQSLWMGRVQSRRGPASRGVHQGPRTRRRTRRLPVATDLQLAASAHARPAGGDASGGTPHARAGTFGIFGGPARERPSDPGTCRYNRFSATGTTKNQWHTGPLVGVANLATKLPIKHTYVLHFNILRHTFKLE